MTTSPAQESGASITPPPVEDAALWMRGIGRRFDDLEVLRDIDLDVPEGRLFGLVGPSGCGKTTLARIAVGLLAQTVGDVRVLGTEPQAFGPKHRQQIGYLPQEFSLYPILTVQQNARFVAGLYGMGWFHRRRRIREVLQYLDLWDARGRLAQDISGGMKRRLSLACALLHEPRFLVVDEPTAGLDPVLRARIRDLLRDIQSRGTTVFLTTQIIEEAEYCDGVGVMRAGRVVAAGAPSALRSQAGLPDTVTVEADRLERGDLAALWDLPDVQHVRPLPDGRAQVVVDRGERVVPAITDALRDRGRAVIAIDSQEASFEDVFLRLVEDARVEGPGARGSGDAEQGGHE